MLEHILGDIHSTLAGFKLPCNLRPDFVRLSDLINCSGEAGNTQRGFAFNLIGKRHLEVGEKHMIDVFNRHFRRNGFPIRHFGKRHLFPKGILLHRVDLAGGQAVRLVRDGVGVAIQTMILQPGVFLVLDVCVIEEYAAGYITIGIKRHRVEIVCLHNGHHDLIALDVGFQHNSSLCTCLLRELSCLFNDTLILLCWSR